VKGVSFEARKEKYVPYIDRRSTSSCQGIERNLLRLHHEEPALFPRSEYYSQSDDLRDISVNNTVVREIVKLTLKYVDVIKLKSLQRSLDRIEDMLFSNNIIQHQSMNDLIINHNLPCD
jgi:hypothetical protein